MTLEEEDQETPREIGEVVALKRARWEDKPQKVEVALKRAHCEEDPQKKPLKP